MWDQGKKRLVRALETKLRYTAFKRCFIKCNTPRYKPSPLNNGVVLEMASEVLPVVKSTPVIAGVCGTDPFRDIPKFLAHIKDLVGRLQAVQVEPGEPC